MKNFTNIINEEAGIRNIGKLAKLHKTAEIYFHQDLDGVTSALAMKEFLKTYYRIETVDCHIIQYGGLEYAIKSHQPENLAVLVDFAHGKPMFHIQSDHHDTQVGAEETGSTYFKPARSNVEIISGEISYNEIFTHTDLELIKTVDSADFYRKGITPDQVQNSIFKYQKLKSPTENRTLMGFVVNRLLLAYKNRRLTVKSLDGKRNHQNRNVLECLLLDSTASLYSMFNNIRHYVNNAKTDDKKGILATPEEVKTNLTNYIKRMKEYSFIEDEKGSTYEISRDALKILKIIDDVKKEDIPMLVNNLNLSLEEVDEHIEKLMNKKYLIFSENTNSYSVTDLGKKVLKGKRAIKGVHIVPDYNILIQYGGGYMRNPGSYDRYTPFKNYPEANFLCIIWPMGLIQVSCNPFKEKALKEIHLGEIAKEVLAKHKSILNNSYISLDSIKYEFETSQDWKNMKKAEGEDYRGVGFRYSDLKAFYSDCIYEKINGKIRKADINDEFLKKAMNISYEDMSYNDKEYLRNIKIPVWEIVQRNSGGHPSITNISGLSFLKYNKKDLEKYYGVEKYVELLKKIAIELVDNLKEKIDNYKTNESFSSKSISNFTGRFIKSFHRFKKS